MTDKPIAKEALISIVVPIYNVEEYLPNCLDTILAQTYSNIEVLLVDDGSPDNAGTICDEYALRDERIKVFHIPNGGVAKARQLGVKNSTGKYIIFVDPDDWLPLDSVEKLLSGIACTAADIVIGSHTRYYQNERTLAYPTQNITYSDNIEFLKDFLKMRHSTAPWAKLFNISLFDNDSFPVFSRAQDLLMNIEIACKANKVQVVPYNVYNYRANSTSSSYAIDLNIEHKHLFCNIIRDTINKYGLMNELNKEFYVASLHQIFNCVKSGGLINSDDQLVKEIRFHLRGTDLSFMEHVMLKT